jgi:mannose-6-phosphate isomerase-like protein (cupin superfamily)
MANYMVAHINHINVETCSCGYVQRAFIIPENQTASLHLLDVTDDDKIHYNKEHTEIYLVLSGDGYVEAGGNLIPLKPETAILIKPCCCHRAGGRMRIANVSIPTYDPKNEYFD